MSQSKLPAGYGMEVQLVEAIGSSIGYGNLMDIASMLWYLSLERQGYPTSGAHVSTIMPFVDDEGKAIIKARRESFLPLIREILKAGV